MGVSCQQRQQQWQQSAIKHSKAGAKAEPVQFDKTE
jgi:hypothetical protein